MINTERMQVFQCYLDIKILLVNLIWFGYVKKDTFQWYPYHPFR